MIVGLFVQFRELQRTWEPAAAGLYVNVEPAQHSREGPSRVVAFGESELPMSFQSDQ